MARGPHGMRPKISTFLGVWPVSVLLAVAVAWRKQGCVVLQVPDPKLTVRRYVSACSKSMILT